MSFPTDSGDVSTPTTPSLLRGQLKRLKILHRNKGINSPEKKQVIFCSPGSTGNPVI